jgi:hypothetical protein
MQTEHPETQHVHQADVSDQTWYLATQDWLHSPGRQITPLPKQRVLASATHGLAAAPRQLQRSCNHPRDNARSAPRHSSSAASATAAAAAPVARESAELSAAAARGAPPLVPDDEEPVLVPLDVVVDGVGAPDVPPVGGVGRLRVPDVGASLPPAVVVVPPSGAVALELVVVVVPPSGAAALESVIVVVPPSGAAALESVVVVEPPSGAAALAPGGVASACGALADVVEPPADVGAAPEAGSSTQCEPTQLGCNDRRS